MYKEPVKEAPCRLACPAGIDVPRQMRLMAEGRFNEALAVVRERIPFAGVCGRICFHPCELKCNANDAGSPLAIMALKRFVAENASAAPPSPARPVRSTGKRVAIIGSGPAGLTAAYYLARLGHAVTVFEALPEPGGMMRVGIPHYRLPRSVLDADIAAIKDAGVDIKTNTRIDSAAGLLKQGYHAVFAALGAHRSLKMDIPGEDNPGVMDCLSLLRDVNMGKKVKLKCRVAVVGGGNAAIDSARVALRSGAQRVTILYRRSREEMPASPGEVEEALKEGVKIQFLTAPKAIAWHNGALRVQCLRMRLGKPDASGRPRPEPIPSSEFDLDVDIVISAIGQAPQFPAQLGLPVAEGNTLKVDPDSLVTGKAGIFAGGDVISGPASVIDAIAAGRKAAISIDKYLGGQGNIEEAWTAPEGAVGPLPAGSPVGLRHEIPSLPVEQRLTGFTEVVQTFSAEAAVEEAKRCLRCDLPILVDLDKCNGCLICQLRCSLKFEKVFSPLKAAIEVNRFVQGGNQYSIAFTERCDTCGICARYCPYGSLTRQRNGKEA